MPYVFDRFSQDKGSIREKHIGLGLGLAIVRHVVEMHGGTVSVYSAGKGKGTTFTIILPLANSGSTPIDTPASIHVQNKKRTMLPELPFDLKGVRALVVDDEEDAREILSTLLTQQGIEVRTSANTEAACAQLDHWRPDVILSDLSMPGKDGLSFIRDIRARTVETGGQVPAVAVTALTRTEDRLRAMQAGYQSHISKPIDPLELFTVMAFLTRKSI